MFDSAIIGGGPAGASCALWLKMLGFNPCIFERRDALGGLQADSPYRNQWIAQIFGKTGVEVAADIHRHIASHGIECRLSNAVDDIRASDDGFVVHAQNGVVADAKTVVLASGVRPTTGGLKAALSLLIGMGFRWPLRISRESVWPSSAEAITPSKTTSLPGSVARPLCTSTPGRSAPARCFWIAPLPRMSMLAITRCKRTAMSWQDSNTTGSLCFMGGSRTFRMLNPLSLPEIQKDSC